MPPPNWDDEFDFDDIDDIPKNKNNNSKKQKPPIDDDDFFDDDAPTNKLPTIASRKSVNKIQPEGRTSATRKNPYVENMNLKGNTNIYDNLDEEFEEQIAEQPPKNVNNYESNKKVTSIKNVSKYAVDDDMQFQEQLADYESPKKNSQKKITYEPLKMPEQPKKKKEEEYQQEQNYDQDFDEDYGEDFEEEIEELPSKKIETPAIKTEPPQQKKSILNVQPPKPPSRKQNTSLHEPAKRNQTLAPKDRNPQMPRVPSRQSIKSVTTNKAARNKSTVNRSRVGTNKNIGTNNSFVQNKYENQIEKQFPNINLNELTPDKLSKLNDRIRAMIKRFNEELNDLINKNMLLLKAKKNQKNSSVADKIRVLEEQKKNNETMIEYMERQYEKLTGRQGELREQEYQLMTEKKIEEAKQKIKETSKLITKLKYNVKNQGNKLTRKSQEKKIAQDLHHLKTNLIQSKKEEQKQIEKIEKLDEQANNLNEKISDTEYQITELIDQAKEKGIRLENRDQTIKKFEEIRKKLQANRNHRSKLEHLLKSKSEIIAHQKEQLKIGIKNCDMEIKNLYGSIEHTHNESVKVVEKAKNNPKVTETLTTELQAILRSLEVTQPDNYSVRSQSNRSRSSHRPLKNSQIANLEKSQPLRSEPSANLQKNKPILFEEAKQTQENAGSTSKPNLLKKKFKIGSGSVENKNSQNQQQKKNQVYQRVWNQQEQEKKKKQLQKQQQQQQKQAEQDKKKPFSLKKNRLSADKNKGGAGLSLGDERPQIKKSEGEGLSLDLPREDNKPEEKKEQEKPSFAGPRMMKFKKRINNEESNTNANNISTNEEPSKSLDPPNLNLPQQTKQQKLVIEEEHKPAFVPKRFNLRKNQEKKDEGNSYMPSAEVKKQEPNKIEEEIGYKPKLDFGAVEDPFAKKNEAVQNNVSPPKNNSYDPFARKQEPPKEKITIPSLEEKSDEVEVKPRFNLRLRDRKKNNEQNNDGYTAGIEKKQEIQQKQNINNPYAPTNNPYAPSNNVQSPKQQAQTINNPYNPYAQQQSNPDAPSRRRQGPVKKTKIQPSGPKQKINIYQQAQEPEGLNQFVKESSPPKNNYEPPSNNLYGKSDDKEPDLNDILGLNKKKNKGNDDFSDLIGGGTKDQKAKKKNDFFLDMDM